MPLSTTAANKASALCCASSSACETASIEFTSLLPQTLRKPPIHPMRIPARRQTPADLRPMQLDARYQRTRQWPLRHTLRQSKHSFIQLRPLEFAGLTLFESFMDLTRVEIQPRLQRTQRLLGVTRTLG